MYRRNIEYRRASALKPHPKDVRNHPAGQIRRLGESIAHYGITNPIFVDENDVVLAGHARLQAAKALGITENPGHRPARAQRC